MTKRVLYIIGDLDVGGAEKHLVSILPHLQKRGVIPHVYTLTHKGLLAPILAEAGIIVDEPPFAMTLRKLPRFLRRIILLPLSIISLVRLFRSGNDVIHFFLPMSYLLGGLVSLIFPSQVRVMSRRSLNVYQFKHPKLARLERWLHGKMNAVLGNSQAVMMELKAEGVKNQHLGLIYNGIDTEPFENLRLKNETRSTLGISDATLVLTIVANLIPYKGHADLVAALGLVVEKMPDDWVLLVVGKDAGIQSGLVILAEQAGVAKNIRWLGLKDNVPDLLAASDIGLLCSHQEGFSNSILEGMAASLPMIVTDVGGNKEAVVNGKTGLVVPPHNTTELGQAILQLAFDPQIRKIMGLAGRARLYKYFTIDSCVSRYLNLYHGVLDKAHAPVQDLIDGK